MWSLETINELNQQAAKKARRGQRQPTVPTLDEIDVYPPFPFAHLGPYVPPGWERVEDVTWFVDSSGFGRPGEPALTAGEFREAVRSYVNDHPDHGFAITEAGQFQVYVGAYRPLAAGEAAA